MKLVIRAFLRRSAWWLILVGLLSAQTARADTFFFDFESGVLPAQFSGAGSVEGTQGYSAVSFGTSFLRNATPLGVSPFAPGSVPADPSTLTLNGLPPHSTFDLSFRLAIIDSWDGFNQPLLPITAPDLFNVAVLGTSAFTVVFSESFSNFNLAQQSFGGAPLTFGAELGFSNFLPLNGAGDSAYEVSLLGIPHTYNTLTVNFFASGAGWQGGTDESWAIDNVSVTVQAVPGPSTLLLLGSGLVGLAGLGRKRLSLKA